MFARFMTATYIRKNSKMYKSFLDCDIPEFCTKEVIHADVECDHPQIIALTSYLKQPVEINSMLDNG